MRKNQVRPVFKKKVSIGGEDFDLNELNIEAIFEQFDKQSKKEPSSANYVKHSDQDSKLMESQQTLAINIPTGDPAPV